MHWEPNYHYLTEAGINAKHSNEDGIAPFEEWIQRYSHRIGLLGGFDVDLLCRHEPEVIFETVVQQGTAFRRVANGYALGSGNSIPDYVPLANYRAVVDAAREIRHREGL